MEHQINQQVTASLKTNLATAPVQYPALDTITKPNLTTAEAGHYLNRRPQTLRAWGCLENGPIRPRRVGGLLAWPTAEVKALAGVQA